MKRDKYIPDLISITEAAQILDMSRQAVHKRIDAGQLPAAMVGSTIVLRRALVEQIALDEGRRVTWADLAADLGLGRDAAEEVARFAGALTPHDPRTGRIPKPWTGKGMDHRIARSEAEDLAAEWHRAKTGGTLPIIDLAEAHGHRPVDEVNAELARSYQLGEPRP